MPAKFPNADLVACVQREVAMRKAVYPKKDKVLTIEECSEKNQREYEMMQAVGEQIAAIPKLLKRYEDAKFELRHLIPQAVTPLAPNIGVLVLVYCTTSLRPYLATRISTDKWRFEDNKDDMVMDGLDSQTIFAFSYTPQRPNQ